MTALQLNLFSPEEPTWIDLSTEWLLNYLQTNYPDAAFKAERITDWGEDYQEILSTASKRACVSFHICTDASLSIWKSTTIICCNIEQYYDSYGGCGVAVDNMSKFKEKAADYINDWRERITTGYTEYKKRKKAEDEE